MTHGVPELVVLPVMGLSWRLQILGSLFTDARPSSMELELKTGRTDLLVKAGQKGIHHHSPLCGVRVLLCVWYWVSCVAVLLSGVDTSTIVPKEANSDATIATLARSLAIESKMTTTHLVRLECLDMFLIPGMSLCVCRKRQTEKLTRLPRRLENGSPVPAHLV